MLTQTTHREKKFLFLLFLVNLVLKFAAFSLNSGEYTDGIIQLTQHTMPETFWPPLYNWLCRFFALSGLSLEAAGKTVSILASSLVIIPVYFLTRYCCNNQQKPALFAVLIYTLSPLHLRWGIRVMTDSLFILFNVSSIYFLFNVFEFRNHQYFFLKYFLYANICLFLANITRYQGVLLIPFALYLLLIVSARFWRKLRNWKKMNALFQKKMLKYTPFFLLSFVPWLYYAGHIGRKISIHAGQFSGRATSDLSQTLGNYFVYFDNFLGHMPFFFNYIVIGFALVGFVRLESDRVKIQFYKLFTVYYFSALLILQALFQSYQERYLLPLLPFVCSFAGIGIFYALYTRSQKTKMGHSYYMRRATKFYPVYIALIVVGIVSLSFTSWAVLKNQSGIFGSIKDAGLFLKEHTFSESSSIYSNEVYNEKKKMFAVKLAFWSDKKIKPLNLNQLGQLKSGDTICIHSVYSGGNIDGYLGFIRQQISLKEIYRSKVYRVVPIFPEVMAKPFCNQNPIWSSFRFQPQYYYSIVYQVTPRNLR